MEAIRVAGEVLFVLGYPPLSPGATNAVRFERPRYLSQVHAIISAGYIDFARAVPQLDSVRPIKRQNTKIPKNDYARP